MRPGERVKVLEGISAEPLTVYVHPCENKDMNNNQNLTVTRVTNGWYTIGGFLTGVEVIRDTPGAFWEVRKNDETVTLAANFNEAKAHAFSLCAA